MVGFSLPIQKHPLRYLEKGGKKVIIDVVFLKKSETCTLLLLVFVCLFKLMCRLSSFIRALDKGQESYFFGGGRNRL